MCMGWPGLTFKMWSSDSFESSEFLVTFIFPSIFCLKYVDNIYTHGWWWLALCIANPPLSLTCFFIWGNACVLVLMFLATPVTCSKTFYPHSLALLWEDCWLHNLTQIPSWQQAWMVWTFYYHHCCVVLSLYWFLVDIMISCILQIITRYTQD